ncbi:hypothetical protein AB0383_48640 [Amycolatopsis sp. NPDC051373]|uniref:glycosyltransferase n=1 Tax=Amycolatopsis sp. NPDC051373 TaxID=3155801 RepID=UPI00344E5668
MRISGVVADHSGCGVYRVKWPMAALAERGHQVTVQDSMPVSVDDLDVLVTQRTCLPGPTGMFLRHCREGRVKTVFEIDDDLWSIDPSNKPAARFYGPELLQNLRACVEAADTVTVTTATLAERLSAWNSDVRVLPNQVPGWLLDHTKPASGNPDRLTIGWRGGTSHSRDFGELAAPLRRFLQHPKYRSRVEFHSMGADQTPRVTTRHGNTRWSDWHEDVTDFLRAIDFDVSVVPLRPSVFNDSKSDLALVEMSALGIPTITSDTGPYASEHRGPNLACSTPAQWTEALHDLTTNPEYRELLGKQAREWATTRTIEANAALWENAYQQ